MSLAMVSGLKSRNGCDFFAFWRGALGSDLEAWPTLVAVGEPHRMTIAISKNGKWGLHEFLLGKKTSSCSGTPGST